MKTNLSYTLTLFFSLTVSTLHSEVVEYDLNISEQSIAPTGKRVKALMINGSIPGPVLRFREGDMAVIRVHNHLKNEQTSIHWHGLILPNEQDGVPYLTTPPIEPGQTHTFEIPMIHAGTYWYHSHTGLQEQRGVYGSIVVEPKNGERIPADHDVVLQLSDWTNERPKSVMRELMRAGEWYSLRKDSVQSITGAMKAGMLGDYLDREWSKMPAMDMSDVAYDQFWINGKTESSIDAKPGDRVRLRIINSGASSYFYVHSAAGPMTIVAADGPDVEPIEADKLLIGMAETYDVIITVPDDGAWEFRATTQDGSGHASVFIGNGEKQLADDIPKPNIYSLDELLSPALDDPVSAILNERDIDDYEPGERPLPPYHQLRSVKPTGFGPEHPRRTLEWTLTGDMNRYTWSFNNKTLAEDPIIKVKRGEVVRIEMVNDTMMHHPIHLHGHFFRLINGQGSHAPLKHTVDVPPMTKRIIEFHATEEKDWLLHCHMIYHMDMGMTRIISYDDQGPDHEPKLDPKLMNPVNFLGEATILNHMTMVHGMLMRGRDDLMAMGMFSYGNHEEYEVDVTWNRYINRNWSTFLGYRFTDEHGSVNRVIGGVNHRLPLMARGFVQVDSEGDFRFGVGKEFQVTDRLSVHTEVDFDTNRQWEWSANAFYLINQRFSLAGGYDSDHGWGAGIQIRF
ncbi:MAG: multicopper oxidase domain-containing protein [Verrucomicrobiota bacterium]